MATKMAPNMEELIQDNQNLVYHLAMRIHRNLPVRHELDDLIGYGMVGLAEAAKNYQPQRGLQFSTYAYHRIRGAIFDGISKVSWMSRARYRRFVRQNRVSSDPNEQLPNDESDNEWEPNEATVGELTNEQIEQICDDEPDTQAQIHRREAAGLLCEVIELLPDRERRLITLVYFEGLSIKEAGDRIGVSKSWASRIHAKSIEQLGMELKRRQFSGGEDI